MSKSPAFRRQVYYLHGFDPRGPKTYHRKFCEQVEIYASRYGVEIDVGPLERGAGTNGCWQVVSQLDGVDVRTNYTVMNWADLTSEHLKQGFWGILKDGLWTGWELLKSGQWFRTCRADKGVALLMLYAHTAIFWYAAISLGLGALAYLGMMSLGMETVPSVLLGLATALLLFQGLIFLDRKLFVFHLMAMFTDSLLQAKGERPETEERLDEFATQISAVKTADFDEVLFVGHSVGANQAISVLARALPAASQKTQFSLLTIGQNVPFVSFHPDAHQLRAEISQFASDPRVEWLDVSSPNDLVSHIGVDITVAHDIPKSTELNSPAHILTKPLEAFSIWTILRLLSNIFETHFLYMYATHRPSNWDWHQTVLGPKRLPERHEELLPVQSGPRRPLRIKAKSVGGS